MADKKKAKSKVTPSNKSKPKSKTKKVLAKKDK